MAGALMMRPVPTRRIRGAYTLTVADLLKVADDLGRKPFWVYWVLSEGMNSVNVPVLHEIARIKKYKPGWAYFKGKEISEKLEQRRKAV